MTNRLAEAVVSLRYRQITALLDKGVGINGRLEDGRTPLMAALDVADADKRRHMFKYLVHHGAEVLESDNGDVTIFQQCCRLGYMDLMEIILKKAGVSAVNMMGRDKHGRTALYHAVTSEDLDVVNTVLDNINLRQQSVDVSDYDGLTPLLYARRYGLTEIADVLIERGKANPRICDRHMHMNADEWAAAAKRKAQQDEAQARKQARERYMIFPPIDHATKRKEKINKSKSRTTSLPNLTKQQNVKIKTTVSAPGGASLPNGESSLTTRLPSVTPSNSRSPHYSLRKENEYDHRTKSIDSAITLLDLASRAADDKEYAQSFVSSREHKSNANAQHKTNINRDRQTRRTWADMMDSYSVQNTSNFRKPAKKPSLPDIHLDDSELSGQKSKMSTLAIIMRATRGGRGNGKSPRGRHKLRSISESVERDHHHQGHPGKLSRRRTTTLSTSISSANGDNKSKLSSPREDDSEWKMTKGEKDKQNSTQKRDTLPDIKVS